MFLLVCAAAVRQIAGLAWANNNTNYLEQYYPNQEIGFYWMTVCSICGGAVGVVSGGYITDQLQKKFGLHSRLWVQSAFFVVAVPFAVLTIYLAPPYCFIALGNVIILTLQVKASGIDIELRRGAFKAPLVKTCLGTILTKFFLHRKGWGIKIT